MNATTSREIIGKVEDEASLPISRIIRQLMAYAQITEADLCRGVNLPQTTINRLLSGQTSDPRISTLAAVAHFFEISIEQLLGREKLVLNLACKQAKGLILPVIDWVYLPNWLSEKAHNDENLCSWIRTEKALNPGSFALPTPSICYSVFGENSLLLMNRLSHPQALDDQIVLIEQNRVFGLRKLLREGESIYLKQLFPPYEISVMEASMEFHAYVVEARNHTFWV